MNIILLNPPTRDDKKFIREGRCTQEQGVWATLWPPLSLATLGAVLEKDGHKVTIYDCAAQGKSWNDNLFVPYGVDILFLGHTHYYERTCPFTSATLKICDETNRGSIINDSNGVVHIITGGGGASISETGDCAWLESKAELHHFLEVETPNLQPLYGGASARPFKTRINAYNIDLFLRIAPELYLKRLLVGGYERVFEFTTNFRNEGVVREHNPEFHVVEWYAAYKDNTWNMELCEEIFETLAEEIQAAHL